MIVKTATGQEVHCKVGEVTFELRRDRHVIAWKAEVAIPSVEIRRPIWGFKGFLEFFRARFDGPGRIVSLTAGPNLPKVRKRTARQ